MRTVIAVAAMLLVRAWISCMTVTHHITSQVSHPPLGGSTPLPSQVSAPAPPDLGVWARAEEDIMKQVQRLHKRSPEADPSGKSPLLQELGYYHTLKFKDCGKVSRN